MSPPPPTSPTSHVPQPRTKRTKATTTCMAHTPQQSLQPTSTTLPHRDTFPSIASRPPSTLPAPPTTQASIQPPPPLPSIIPEMPPSRQPLPQTVPHPAFLPTYPRPFTFSSLRRRLLLLPHNYYLFPPSICYRLHNPFSSYLPSATSLLRFVAAMRLPLPFSSPLNEPSPRDRRRANAAAKSQRSPPPAAPTSRPSSAPPHRLIDDDTLSIASAPASPTSPPAPSRPLNTPSRTASPDAPDDAVAISANLKGAIQRLYVAHITPDGVDYRAMASSPALTEYVSAAARLPALDVERALPDDDHKLAFYINLYNAMTQHAVAIRGPPPTNGALRLMWGLRTAYTVGRYRLSLHDVENGVLRQNRRISVVPAPFGMLDARRRLCVQRVDPRIHFVLNCAATSCPPVLFVTVENVREVLTGAAASFLADEGNLRVREGVVALSMIFKWYREDFAPDGSDASLLAFVARNAREDAANAVQLTGLLAEREGQGLPPPPIEWLPYDWTLNSV